MREREMVFLFFSRWPKSLCWCSNRPVAESPAVCVFQYQQKVADVFSVCQCKLKVSRYWHHTCCQVWFIPIANKKRVLICQFHSLLEHIPARIKRRRDLLSVYMRVCHVWERDTRCDTLERERESTAHQLVACVQTPGTSSRKHRETFTRSPRSNVRPQVIYSPSN